MQIKRILIADDEPNLRITLADILRDEGYQVDLASSGEQAVTLCLAEDYDVVLMDLRMPGMGGVEAFQQIRRHCEALRVIMMSAYSVDEIKRSALQDGAIAFLTKPLDMDHVISLIEEVHDTAILVVENEADTAKMLTQSLKQQGYRVTVTGSPHDALELVEQIRFDIILMDVQLPTMTGLDLYLAIKKLTPSSVTIMISGMEEEFERLAKEAVRQTAYTFVRKPLDIDKLIGLLERLSGQRISNAIEKPNPEQF